MFLDISSSESVDGVVLLVENSQFVHNTGRSSAQGLSLAILLGRSRTLHTFDSMVTVKNSNFVENGARGRVVYGGGVNFAASGKLLQNVGFVVSGCAFLGNRAGNVSFFRQSAAFRTVWIYMFVCCCVCA